LEEEASRDRQTNRQADKQTERQTDKQEERNLKTPSHVLAAKKLWSKIILKFKIFGRRVRERSCAFWKGKIQFD
jgi:hypothetical protein